MLFLVNLYEINDFKTTCTNSRFCTVIPNSPFKEKMTYFPNFRGWGRFEKSNNIISKFHIKKLVKVLSSCDEQLQRKVNKNLRKKNAKFVKNKKSAKKMKSKLIFEDKRPKLVKINR